MIDVITWDNAHKFGDVLPGLLRLRHRIFVQGQGYAVPTHQGMEWDQFDTPASVYLCWRYAIGQPQGCLRLLPTTLPYMIKELWPELIGDGQFPADGKTWEWTRLGVDHNLPNAQRMRVLGELLCGGIEFGLRNGISNYLFVTPTRSAVNLYKRLGVIPQILGEERAVGAFRVVAGRIPVQKTVLDHVREQFAIRGPVLREDSGSFCSQENAPDLASELHAA